MGLIHFDNRIGIFLCLLNLFVILRTNRSQDQDLVDYSCLHQDSWLVNRDAHYNFIFSALTDVTSAAMNDLQYEVTSKGIPNYDRTFTAEDVKQLDSRPYANYEFSYGKVKLYCICTMYS